MKIKESGNMKFKKLLTIAAVVPLLIFSDCKADNPVASVTEGDNPTGGKVVQLTNESFKQLVYNYEAGKEWKFEGKKPAIIDFYADWCGPCRQLSPLVEEIAREYSGKIDVYKVDTDKETVLAQSLGITGLPTILFIPAEGMPQAAMGALPKETLKKAISEVLKVNSL